MIHSVRVLILTAAASCLTFSFLAGGPTQSKVYGPAFDSDRITSVLLWRLPKDTLLLWVEAPRRGQTQDSTYRLWAQSRRGGSPELVASVDAGDAKGTLDSIALRSVGGPESGMELVEVTGAGTGASTVSTRLFRAVWSEAVKKYALEALLHVQGRSSFWYDVDANLEEELIVVSETVPPKRDDQFAVPDRYYVYWFRDGTFQRKEVVHRWPPPGR